MHHGFALRYIPQVMNWSAERENAETVWLRLISEYKYDSYQDFRSGSRFVESLLDWLQQFAPEDREKAYSFIRNHLIFISFAELQHLVRRAFPSYVRPLQISRAARKIGVPPYLIWSTADGARKVQAISQRSLFVGLSDGARMDAFRRDNVGLISNEQVSLAYDTSDEKWKDLHNELKKRTNDQNAKFELIVFLDDFAGSGTTLLRLDPEKNAWKGKLPKISQTLTGHQEMLDDDCDVLIHHYVGTDRALSEIEKKIEMAKSDKEMKRLFQGRFILNFGIQLSETITFTPGKSADVDGLVDRYYDPSIMTPSLSLGGKDAKHGFAKCGLPLIMEHNTPNNSLAILWAESESGISSGHEMRPLFRRRQRHY